MTTSNNMKKIYFLFCFIFVQTNILAQNNTEVEDSNFSQFFTKNIEYQARAQFSIGGSAPLNFPASIRKINSYNPTLQLGLEVNATKWFNDNQKWGIRTGLRFEGRGMKTDAQVKNYYTEVDGGNGKYTKGYFTGNVKTKMKNSYITFPVLAVYNASELWNFSGGLYFSGLIDKDFNGYVYEGTLREDSPIGTPIEFEGDAKGDYDFSENLNHFQWGLQVGSEYKMNQNFKLFADLNWGINNLFEKDFTAIQFNMYSIYLNLGFGYTF